MPTTWHSSPDYTNLAPITQVYGICFDSNGCICIMRTPGYEWNIPGGTPLIGEEPVQTLNREFIEEVNLELGISEMIGYFQVIEPDRTFYQLRYATLLTKILPQAPDPATNLINERLFVLPTDFFNYIKIEDYHPLLEQALIWYKNKINKSQPC